MTDNFKQTFNIVRNVGDPTKAKTPWGQPIEKMDKLFVQDFSISGQNYTGFIECIDYGVHFIYEVPNHPRFLEAPGSAYMCTCGAMAGVLGSSAFMKDGTIQGAKFGCLHRSGMINQETGEQHKFHADGTP